MIVFERGRPCIASFVGRNRSQLLKYCVVSGLLCWGFKPYLVAVFKISYFAFFNRFVVFFCNTFSSSHWILTALYSRETYEIPRISFRCRWVSFFGDTGVVILMQVWLSKYDSLLHAEVYLSRHRLREIGLCISVHFQSSSYSIRYSWLVKTVSSSEW